MSFLPVALHLLARFLIPTHLLWLVLLGRSATMALFGLLIALHA